MAAGHAVSWLQLETRTGLAEPAALEERLQALGAVAIWLRDAADEPLFEPQPGSTPLWMSSIVTALFPATADATELTAALAPLVAASELQFSEVEDRNWQAEWQASLRPLHFGDRLVVVPDSLTVAAAGAAVVRLAPGLAFGSGEHPTTALCLEWLSGLDLAGRTVLDYGCGSGLLAIAALALGAAAATAVDIDPQALAATRANAGANDVADRLTACRPDELAADAQYDVLVANILSDTLIELGPTLQTHVRGGARLAATGILADQADAVAAAWSGWATLDERRAQGEWILLAGQAHEPR